MSNKEIKSQKWITNQIELGCVKRSIEQTKALTRPYPKDKGKKKTISPIGTNRNKKFEGYIEEIDEDSNNLNPLTSLREARYVATRGTTTTEHEVILELVKPQHTSTTPCPSDGPRKLQCNQK